MTARRTILAEHKAIAAAARRMFGGKPKVHRYGDDPNRAYIDLVSCVDSPTPGVTAYATIGVSDIPLVQDGRVLDVRAELVGACGSQFELFANVMATAAFCVINSRWFVAPGIMFPDVVSMYDATLDMKHLLFLPPFLRGDDDGAIVVDKKTIGWLLAIPISNAKCAFAEENGVPALEAVFEREQIDIFDLGRTSVV